MAISYHIPFLPESIPFSIQVIGLSLLAAVIYFVYSSLTADGPWPDIPVISLSEETGLTDQESWIKHGRETIDKGLRTTSGAFQVMTGTGPKIVLPNRYANDPAIKNGTEVSFFGAFKKDLFLHYPGFEAFNDTVKHDENFLAEVVRVKLTQSLGLVTPALVDETTEAVHDIFGDNPEWHEVKLRETLLHLVARLSSRVFLGKELCRNERWLEVAKMYTVYLFTAARELRAKSPFWRRLNYEFMDSGKKLRKLNKDAAKLITPIVEQHKQTAQKALDAGGKPPKVEDAIGWMVETARENRQSTNYVAGQLTLSLAAMHTTTEAMTTAVHDLAEHPEFISPLRDEIISVISTDGWSKTALYKLKLMDSFLKESQRFHPPSTLSMNRLVNKRIQLSDGTILPAGSRIAVAGPYKDSHVYENPESFDPWRFYRERENPEHINSWQHVTISPQHMAFGYGNHACPGRFFASNELKIALAHLLLKYDWKPTEDKEKAVWIVETNSMVNPGKKIQLKRREAEIDLDTV